MPDDVHTGNVAFDSLTHGGWLIGNLLPEGPRHSDTAQIKWDDYRAGDSQEGWTTNESRTTFVMLIRGSFQVELLSTGVFPLRALGDYVVWGPGIDHTWRANEASAVLTVRWPSSRA
jgi:hypothetical protein